MTVVEWHKQKKTRKKISATSGRDKSGVIGQRTIKNYDTDLRKKKKAGKTEREK